MRFSRRAFLRRSGELGIAATALSGVSGCGISLSGRTGGSVLAASTAGDVAILRFLAAAEILETDLWDQYCELVSGNDAYREALESIDDEMPAYICDNTADERSHAEFLNAYVASIGGPPVDLEPFRTLTPPAVNGLEGRPRLTNLTRLTIDTSWIERYMSSGNPDFGDRFEQLVEIQNRPAIPTANGLSDDQILAAAYAAAFHFGSIEQGGTSLYVNMLTRARSADAVRIVASIGPTEAWHLTIWRETIGGIRALDTGDGLVFPDLSTDEEIHEHVMPNPCKFFDESLPLCSVVRPMSTANAGAVAAATFLTNSGLFDGQSQEFFDTLTSIARAADAATRG
jgi:hypothetical protein